MRLSFLPVFILALVTSACAEIDASVPDIRRAGSQSTVTYCGSQKMDLSGRKGQGGSQAVILYIHGGGWETGDRKGGFERRRLKPLVQNGFIVATLDYRLAPQHRHPAQIHDVKCAIKYLRHHGPALGIDSERIGVMGDSAGGHLAALAALTSPQDGLEGPNLAGVSSDVQAAATFYGIFDLVNVEPHSLAVDAVTQNFPNRAARAQGSPIIYLDAADPPFLIVHGKQDRFVDIAQSVKLTIGLKNAGHAPLLVAVENAGHGLVARGGKPMPETETIDQLLVAFFTEHLAK